MLIAAHGVTPSRSSIDNGRLSSGALHRVDQRGLGLHGGRGVVEQAGHLGDQELGSMAVGAVGEVAGVELTKADFLLLALAELLHPALGLLRRAHTNLPAAAGTSGR